MMQKYKDQYDTSAGEYSIEEEKFQRHSSLRQDTELFDDESYKPQEMISVKRIGFARGEDWEVSQGDKIALVLKGVRFTTKEKEFLRTPEGLNFIIRGYKEGWKSVSEFKRNIKGKA